MARVVRVAYVARLSLVGWQVKYEFLGQQGGDVAAGTGTAPCGGWRRVRFLGPRKTSRALYHTPGGWCIIYVTVCLQSRPFATRKLLGMLAF